MTSTWNAAFAYDNLADAATITASSYEPLFPATMLQNEHVGRKWRAKSNIAEYVTIDLGSAQSFDTVMLAGTNLTSAASKRLRASNTDTTAQDGALYDSGTPMGLPGTETYGMELFLLDEPVSAQYLRIDLTEGAVDYIEVGRLFVGVRHQVGINFAPGAQRSRVSNSRKVKGRGGQTFIDRNTKYRRWSVEFQALSDTEAWGFIEDMEMQNGDDTDILLIRDPSSTNLGRDSIWGLLSEMNPLTETSAMGDVLSKSFTIEERL